MDQDRRAESLLRPYQKEAVESLVEEKRQALCVIPTGGGKTEIFIDILNKTQHLKSLVVLNRVDLLDQTVKRLDRPIRIFCGSRVKDQRDSAITVATIQSILKSDFQFDQIFLDECFTPDVEILTEHGFVRFDDLKKSIRVAQFNLKNKLISFCRPTKYIKKRFAGDLLEAKVQKNIDITATPKHEMLVLSRDGVIKCFLKDIKTGSYANYKMYKAGLSIAAHSKLSPIEKIQIAFQADGSFHSQKKIYFSFSKKRKIQKFFELMKEGRFDFCEIKGAQRENNVRRRRRFSVSLNFKVSKNLFDAFDLTKISAKKGQSIIEYMTHWDGHIVSKTMCYFSSVVKSNADFYQAVCCLSGYSTNMTVQKDRRKSSFRDVYRLFIKTNKDSCGLQRLKINKKRYNGFVYCVSVPEGNIIIRRSGKPLVVGNCHAIEWERKENRYAKLLQKYEEAKVYGFTATPYRNNGPIYGTGKFFPEITFKVSMKELLDLGFLVPPTLKGSKFSFDTKGLRTVAGEYDQSQVAALVSDEIKLRHQVSDALDRLEGRNKIVWFCANIKHAEKIRNRLVDSLESAAILHSNLSEEERVFNKNKFENTPCRHLVFVTIVAEGYDYPPIDAIVFLRPTKSANLYVQVSGRGLRPYGNKKDCLILDYARVIENLGPLDDPKIPQPKKKKEPGEPAIMMRQCPHCFQMVHFSVKICPECEFVLVKDEPVLTRRPEAARNLLSFENKAKLKEATIEEVAFLRHVSKSGKPCIRARYKIKESVLPLSEYLPLDGFYYRRTLHVLNIFGLKMPMELPKSYVFTKKMKMVYEEDVKWVRLIRLEGTGD